MQGYNLIVVFDKTEQKLLMCKRKKEPYKGLSNFVGGKIEAGEEGYAAAYRELEEETSITKNDIILTDDTSAIETLGIHSYIYSGDYNNIKITTPEDLILAEYLSKLC